MDRKVTAVTSLAPVAGGWRVDLCANPDVVSGAAAAGCRDCSKGCGETHVPSFADAVATLAVPAAARFRAVPQPRVRVALPARLAIFERLTLPSVDRQELSDMVRLQLEKILPYPMEEARFGFQTVSQREKPAAGAGAPIPGPETKFTLESTIVVCVVHNPSVEAFCAPLLERKIFPERLTIWAMHVAAQAQRAGVVCGIWQEESGVVFAVYENGILSFAEIIDSPENVADELPQVVMGAELAGATTTFSAVLLDPALAHLSDQVTRVLGAPVEELHTAEVPCAAPAEDPVDLRLDSWHAELARQQRASVLHKQLAVAGVVYCLFMLSVFAWLSMLEHQLQAVENEMAKALPDVNAIHAQQARWTSLASAVDQRRFTLELLSLAFQSLPSSDVRFTKFESAPNGFTLEGEAPDAGQAVDLGTKLKAQSDLRDFHFDSSSPVPLPNNHWQFRFFGKL